METNLETVNINTSIGHSLHREIWNSVWLDMRETTCRVMPDFTKREVINNRIAVPVNVVFRNIERAISRKCTTKLLLKI